MKLNELKIGQSAYITTVEGQGATRQHFLDLGIIPGMEVTLVKFAPMNDPIQVMVSGYELTIRLDDAKKIGIKDVHTKKQTENTLKITSDIGHPPFWAKRTIRKPIVMSTITSQKLKENWFLLWQVTRTAAKPPCSIS